MKSDPVMSSEITHEDDTCEELLDLSRANAQAIILATASFLRECDVPVEAWANALGRTFADAWDEDLAMTPADFLDAMLTNFKAIGASVIRADLSNPVATATLGDFPQVGLCRELGVEDTAADPYLDIPRELAGRLGLSWGWERTSRGLTIRASAGQS
jgi:hypothetical protein